MDSGHRLQSGPVQRHPGGGSIRAGPRGKCRAAKRGTALAGAFALLASFMLFAGAGPAAAGEALWHNRAQTQLAQSRLPEGFAAPLDDGGLELVRGLGASEGGVPGGLNQQDLSIILWDESQGRPRSGGSSGSGSGSSGQTSNTINGQSY